MDWPTDRGLQVRMVATLALTAAVAVAGAATTYAGVRLLLWLAGLAADVPLGGGTVHAVSLVGATAFLLGVVASELWLGRGLGLPEVDARDADRDVHPALAGHVDRIARQLDVPRPTVALTDDPVPLAMTTGLTPASATLVVSTGLLAVLDDDELEAVVAHELAHVRNRDAAVTTAAALPTVVADAIRQWVAGEPPDDGDAAYAWERPDADGNELDFDVQYDAGADRGEGRHAPERGGLGAPGALLYGVATAFWFVGRVLLSLLSRYRELAADRAAVAVTGSPAALASALRTLTDADRPPGDDRRTRHAVDAFAIVPEDPPEPVRLGPDGEREQAYAGLTRWLHRVSRTHPELDRRLSALRELQAHVETRDTT